MRYITPIAILLIICSCTGYGEKIPYGKSEVYYTDNVSKEQAQKLGDYLQANQFFKEDRKVSVQLDKAADTMLFRMVVLDNFVNDPSYIENAKTSISQLSKDVFDMKPAIIHFCDNRFKTIKIIRKEE